MAEKSIRFLIDTLELNVMHPQGVDVVLAASVAGLQVEKFGIRITFGEKSDAGSLSSNDSLQGRSQLKSATVSYLLRTGVFIFGKQCKTVFLSCFAQIHRGPQTPMAKGSSATV